MKAEPMTAAELTRLAKEVVSDKLLDEALKGETFREFARIFTFMLMNTAESKVSSSFGHFFMIRDQSKKPVSIGLDINMTVEGH